MQGVIVNRPKRADVDELRRRLDADEWLLPGEVGALFDTSRWTVDYWLTTGKIDYKRGPGRQRTCNPEDVRRLLAEKDVVHRAGDEPAPGPTGRDQGQEP